MWKVSHEKNSTSIKHHLMRTSADVLGWRHSGSQHSREPLPFDWLCKLKWVSGPFCHLFCFYFLMSYIRIISEHNYSKWRGKSTVTKDYGGNVQTEWTHGLLLKQAIKGRTGCPRRLCCVQSVTTQTRRQKLALCTNKYCAYPSDTAVTLWRGKYCISLVANNLTLCPSEGNLKKNINCVQVTGVQFIENSSIWLGKRHDACLNFRSLHLINKAIAVFCSTCLWWLIKWLHPLMMSLTNLALQRFGNMNI